MKDEKFICPICNFKAIKLLIYNGQNMCLQCKKALQKGRAIKKYKRDEK